MLDLQEIFVEYSEVLLTPSSRHSFAVHEAAQTLQRPWEQMADGKSFQMIQLAPPPLFICTS